MTQKEVPRPLCFANCEVKEGVSSSQDARTAASFDQRKHQQRSNCLFPCRTMPPISLASVADLLLSPPPLSQRRVICWDTPANPERELINSARAKTKVAPWQRNRRRRAKKKGKPGYGDKGDRPRPKTKRKAASKKRTKRSR